MPMGRQLPLLHIGLDYHPAIDQRAVLFFMLCLEVRVHGMPHIGADKERPAYRGRMVCR